jgi:hypothetical protein
VIKLYPWIFQTPRADELFEAGPASKVTWFLNTAGNGSWRRGPNGLRNHIKGSAVMYDIFKILVAGDSSKATETIDLGEASPRWQSAGSLLYTRKNLNLTVLPVRVGVVHSMECSPDDLEPAVVGNPPPCPVRVHAPYQAHMDSACAIIVDRWPPATSTAMPPATCLPALPEPPLPGQPFVHR